MNKSKKGALIFFSFFLAYLFLLTLSYYFLEVRIKEKSGKLVDIKRSLALAENRSENRGLEAELIDKIGSDSQKIDSLFINLDEPIGLIKFFEELASQCNVSIKITASSATSSEENNWKSIDFQINSSGSVANSLKFIEKLDRSPYILEIENASIRLDDSGEALVNNTDKTANNQLKFDLTVRVYSK